MRSTVRGILSVLVLAIVIAVPSSCSNTTLDSGTEALAVNYTPNPSGSGRFERASFNIMVVRFLPTDPQLAAIYGTTPLSMRFDQFTADLTKTTATTFTQIGLATGSYKVVQMDFSSPALVDTDVSANPATCLDGIVAFPSGPATGQVPATTSFVNPPNVGFTVAPGQTTLALTVDVPSLINGYTNAFTCTPNCNGTQPCLTAFDQAAYSAALFSSISFH